jgi:hypothetical protein
MCRLMRAIWIEGLKHTVDAHDLGNRRFTTRETHEFFPNISRFALPRLSQLNSDTEKYVSDRLQEYSQMNTHRRRKETATDS